MSSQAAPEPGLPVRDKAEDMTFAVELKFLIRQNIKDVNSTYGNVRDFVPHLPERLRNTMTEAEARLWDDNWEAVAKVVDAISGVSATSRHQSQEQRTGLWKTHWMVYKANSACPPYMSYFQNDPNLPIFDAGALEYGKHAWTPVEVCSPILLWKHKTEGLSTLTTILEILNKQLDIVANASTEVHVHVGRADGNFYSLVNLKKLATIFWLAEPLLRAVKDPKSPNYDHHYTWSYAMRENSRIGMALAGKLLNGQRVDGLYTGTPNDFGDFLTKLMDGRHPWSAAGYGSLREHMQALRAIWSAADNRELAHMLRGPERKFRRLGFNFHALELDAAGETTPRTIEFRFLEGLIDAKIVPAWVRLCGELMDVVADQDDAGEENWEFYDLVAALLSIPKDWPVDVQFSELMVALGRTRIPRSVSDPLHAVVRQNYPFPGYVERD